MLLGFDKQHATLQQPSSVRESGIKMNTKYFFYLDPDQADGGQGGGGKALPLAVGCVQTTARATETHVLHEDRRSFIYPHFHITCHF